MAFEKSRLRNLRFLPLNNPRPGSARSDETATGESICPRTISAEEAAVLAVRTAVDQKALDVRALRMAEVTDIADYFVICSGTSDRHVRGIAEKILQALKSVNDTPITVSGLERSEWVLLDFADVVVHIFYEPARQFYNLDGLWSAAKELPVPDELSVAARRLRTGIY